MTLLERLFTGQIINIKGMTEDTQGPKLGMLIVLFIISIIIMLIASC